MCNYSSILACYIYFTIAIHRNYYILFAFLQLIDVYLFYLCFMQHFIQMMMGWLRKRTLLLETDTIIIFLLVSMLLIHVGIFYLSYVLLFQFSRRITQTLYIA